MVSLVGDLATGFSQNAGVKTRATVPYIEQSIMMLLQQPDQDSKEKANYTLQAIKGMNLIAARSYLQDVRALPE